MKRIKSHSTKARFAGILGLTVAVATAVQAGQPNFQQIYDFNAVVGPSPVTGYGNVLYGATQTGGSQGKGSIYAMTPPATPGGDWTYTTLYDFGSATGDGINPYGVAIGGVSAGLPVLYGTTSGGGRHGGGTVFSLNPPRTLGGAWTERILHSFSGPDGKTPLAALVAQTVPGQLPVLYGTTGAGGAGNGGAVFMLTPPAAPGSAWTETVIHSFIASDNQGEVPNNVVLGSAAGGSPVLYGFAVVGGAFEGGVIFEITSSGGEWTYNVIYNLPQSTVFSSPNGLSLGNDGVLYGTTAPGALGNAGAVYSLSPPALPGGSWTETTIYAFGSNLNDGVNPIGVAVANTGMLYGATSDGGLGFGTVYSLTPPLSPGGAWTENILYSFPFNGATGAPANIVIGPHGLLYGYTNYIGGNTVSSIFEVRP